MASDGRAAGLSEEADLGTTGTLRLFVDEARVTRAHAQLLRKSQVALEQVRRWSRLVRQRCASLTGATRPDVRGCRLARASSRTRRVSLRCAELRRRRRRLVG